MPHYKLVYFNIRALGEGIRLLFAYSGTQFEDVRISREEWPNLKPSIILRNDRYKCYILIIYFFLQEIFFLTDTV